METNVQRLGRRTGKFAEMLFCCPVLFILFSSFCSAGQWLRRSILTLVSHTYQKHFALGISLLPWSWSPFFLSFQFKWKDINYYVEILPVLVWRALHWSCPDLSITAIQEQLQRTFVIGVGPIRWATDVWEVPGYGISSSQFVGRGWLKSRRKQFGSGPDLYLYWKCGRKSENFPTTPMEKHPLFPPIFFVILWSSAAPSWDELSARTSSCSRGF